jgi:hypothetical protein
MDLAASGEMQRVVVLAILTAFAFAAAPSDGHAGPFGRGKGKKPTPGTAMVVYQPPGVPAASGQSRALVPTPSQGRAVVPTPSQGRSLVRSPGRALVPSGPHALPTILRRVDTTAAAPAAAATAAPAPRGRLRRFFLTAGLATAMAAGLTTGLGDATLSRPATTAPAVEEVVPEPAVGQADKAPIDGALNAAPAETEKKRHVTPKSTKLKIVQNGKKIGVSKPGVVGD